MRVYSLTPMTRSVNLQRRVVIQGFDLPMRGLTIAGFALIPALPLTAMVWPFLGVYALFTLFIVEAAAFWMIETRTRSGLKLRRYQRFLDMRKSVEGSFMICGEVVHPNEHLFGYVVDSSTPGRPATMPDLAPIADSGSQSRRMVSSSSRRK